MIDGGKKNKSTTDLEGCLEFQEVGLVGEDIPGDKTKLLDFRLRKLDLFAGPVSDFEQPIDDTIKNRTFHWEYEVSKVNTRKKRTK